MDPLQRLMTGQVAQTAPGNPLQSLMSDATPYPVLSGQQYAMEQKPNPYEQIVGGRVRGGEGGAGGAKPEILSPKSVSTEQNLRGQLQELESQQRALMQHGPMVPELIKLGVTPAQMTKMNPAEAYQFIKARSPQGMGQVDREAQKMVMDTIEQIRQQRAHISGLLFGE